MLNDYVSAWNSLSSSTQEQLEPNWKSLTQTLDTYKALEHDHRLPPLWIAIYGGTNTGKSAIFNLLMNSMISPSKMIASATRQPVVTVSDKYQNHLELTQHFTSLSSTAEVLNEPKSVASTACYFHYFSSGDGPLGTLEGADHLALIDCPDHDSSSEMNREVAELVLSYADRCLYITTPQKYKTVAVKEALMRLVSEGMTVGVVFNLLEPQQDSKVLWDDLLQTLDEQGLNLADFTSKVSLLGGLPRVSLKEPKGRQALRLSLIEFLTLLIGGQDPRMALRRESLSRVLRALKAFQDHITKLNLGFEEEELEFSKALAHSAKETLQEVKEHHLFQVLYIKFLKRQWQQVSQVAYTYRCHMLLNDPQISATFSNIHQTIDDSLWRVSTYCWSLLSDEPVHESLEQAMNTLYDSSCTLSSIEMAWSKSGFKTAWERLLSQDMTEDQTLLFNQRMKFAESALQETLNSHQDSVSTLTDSFVFLKSLSAFSHRQWQLKYDLINSVIALSVFILSHSVLITFLMVSVVALSQSIFTRLRWLRKVSASGSLLDEITNQAFEKHTIKLMNTHQNWWLESARSCHPHHAELQRLGLFMSTLENTLETKGITFESR